MNEPEFGNDWYSRMQKEREDETAKAITTLKSLCEQFAALGIEEVRLVYDGYGDSGVIEEIKAMSNEEDVPLDETLRNNFTDAAYSLLPLGWEDNAGSFGDLILYVEERQVVREHRWRMEEVDYDEEEWQL